MKLCHILKIDFDSNRTYGLDILRALAILFVVIGHGSHYLPSKFLQDISNSFVFDGVSIFFILSGYLIGGILIKNLESKPATLKTLFNFWKRRWFRTLPNYYFILVLLIVLNYVFHLQMKSPWNFDFGITKYFCFLQNFNVPHPFFFDEAWSLCVEEWFYLLVPSFIFICVGIFHVKTKKSILLVAITAIIFTTCFRYFRYINFPHSISEWDLNYRKQVITRLDSLMFGVIGAFFL